MPLQLHGNGRIGKNRGQDIYGLKFNETMSTVHFARPWGCLNRTITSRLNRERVERSTRS
jgi:hypothetical protein